MVNPKSLSEIEDLCDKIFGQGLACCPGQLHNPTIGLDRFPADSPILVEYPFKRMVSPGCALLHETGASDNDIDTLALCTGCRNMVSEERGKADPEEKGKLLKHLLELQESLIPEVKLEELQEGKRDSLDEGDFYGNFNPVVEDTEPQEEVIEKYEPQENGSCVTPRESTKRRAKIAVNYAVQLGLQDKKQPKGEDFKSKKHRKYLRNPNRLVGRTLKLPKLWTQERTERLQCEHCDVTFGLENSIKSLRGRAMAKHYRKKHL